MTARHRPMTGLALSFGLGILLECCWDASFGSVFAGIFLLLFLSWRLQNKAFFATAFTLLVFLFLGFIYAQVYRYPAQDDIIHKAKYYWKKPVQVKGVAVSDIVKRKFFNGEKTTFTLEVRELKTNWGWQKRTGKVLIQAFGGPGVAYGDELLLEGKLHYPFNFFSDKNFSYREYLKNKEIRLILSVKKDGLVKVVSSHKGNMIKDYALSMRSRLKKIFKKYLTANESAIMQAMILGERQDMPKHIRELFEQTGTAHILAISGLHIGIVVFLILLVVRMIPVPRKGQYMITIAVLLFYALMTGARPSVVRATIMATVFLAGFCVERESDALNSLFLASFIILLINPMNIFDIGFQLSFSSVFFIIIFYPVIYGLAGGVQKPFKFTRNPVSFLKQSVAVSVAAWLGVGGFIVYYFQIITPVTVLANVLIIPLIGMIVALGFGLLIAAFIVPAGAVWFAISLKLFLNLMAGAIFLMSRLPGAYFYTGNIPVYLIILYYILIISILILVRHTRLTK